VGKHVVAAWLLRRRLPAPHADSVLGDLLEAFALTAFATCYAVLTMLVCITCVKVRRWVCVRGCQGGHDA
jgi:hypothetical protein